MDPADLPFWELISRAAFCNPFDENRAVLDREILGRAVDPFTGERVELLLQAIAERMGAIERAGLGHLNRLRGTQREVMKTAFLFQVYHRYCREFDQLIPLQLERGDQAAPVPFAVEALRELGRRGFERAEAVRYFAIFYQLRRAFYFIIHGLLGGSASMQELRRSLWNNVFTQDAGLFDRHLWDRMEDFSTLLLGETGTGKGTAAAAIGRSGFIPFAERRGCFVESFARNFIALNLSQYPESLIESELFGHRKGAFTGAVEAHEGVLARCSPHGSIFLDEIGEVSVPVQIKLLQVLQERTFHPVGSHQTIRFRGRVIAATNRPLEELRGGGGFRDDFYYRLCSDLIEVPPLRRRLREDAGEMEHLVGNMIRGLVEEDARSLSGWVLEVLRRDLPGDYAWPGNVRELEQAVRRILLSGRYQPTVVPDGGGTRGQWLREAEAGDLDADGVLSGYCRQLHAQLGSYEAVARQTRLDPRTVKKYVGL